MSHRDWDRDRSSRGYRENRVPWDDRASRQSSRYHGSVSRERYGDDYKYRPRARGVPHDADTRLRDELLSSRRSQTEPLNDYRSNMSFTTKISNASPRTTSQFSSFLLEEIEQTRHENLWLQEQIGITRQGSAELKGAKRSWSADPHFGKRPHHYKGQDPPGQHGRDRDSRYTEDTRGRDRDSRYTGELDPYRPAHNGSHHRHHEQQHGRFSDRGSYRGSRGRHPDYSQLTQPQQLSKHHQSNGHSLDHNHAARSHHDINLNHHQQRVANTSFDPASSGGAMLERSTQHSDARAASGDPVHAVEAVEAAENADSATDVLTVEQEAAVVAQLGQEASDGVNDDDDDDDDDDEGGTQFSDSTAENAIRERLLVEAKEAAAQERSHAVKKAEEERKLHINNKAASKIAAIIRSTNQRLGEMVVCFIDGSQVHKSDYPSYLASFPAPPPDRRPVRVAPDSLSTAEEIRAYNAEAIAVFYDYWVHTRSNGHR